MPANLRPTLILDARPAAALGAGVTVTTDYIATCPMVLTDAHTIAVATAGVSGTASMARQALGAGAFNVMFNNPITMTTQGNVVRLALAGTFNVVIAQRVVAATDVLRTSFVDGGGGGGANGHLYAHLVLLPIPGA